MGEKPSNRDKILSLAFQEPDGRVYLPKSARLYLFRSRNRRGRVNVIIDGLDDYHALVRAEIFQDADDPMPIAVNIAERRFAMDAAGQEAPFLEEAITSAVGRALGTAGYNLLSVMASADEFDLKPLYPAGKFDPMQYAVQADNGGFFLEADTKVAWFRSVFPNGKICTSTFLRNEVTAVIRADVYLDKNDQFPVSTNYAARSLGPGEFAQNYVQSAATAAIGRALTNAGFNLIGAVDDWEAGVVDTPVIASPTRVAQQVEQQEQVPEPVQPIISASAETPATISLPDIAAEAVKKMEEQSAPAAQPSFFDEIYQEYLAEKEAEQTGMEVPLPQMPEMSEEDARQTVISFGQHKGEKLGEVDQDTLQWIATKYRGKDSVVKEAARTLFRNQSGSK